MDTGRERGEDFLHSPRPKPGAGDLFDLGRRISRRLDCPQDYAVDQVSQRIVAPRAGVVGEEHVRSPESDLAYDVGLELLQPPAVICPIPAPDN